MSSPLDSHVEALAVLAHAAGLGRLTASQYRTAKCALGDLMRSLDWVEADIDLVTVASKLAETRALGAYDAVHLTAAERIGPREVVVVAGDRALLAAARTRGITVATIRSVARRYPSAATTAAVNFAQF